MAFCSNCGQKLNPKDNFCPKCGTPVEQEAPDQRRQVYEGTIHKCPNCGEVINAFTPRCPACGFEFRDAGGSTAVSELAAQIQEIEKQKSKQAATPDILSIFTPKVDFDAQEIELIRNFSIPNTKEDVYEFVILASSNINAGVYQKSSTNSLSDAWMAKAEQAYHKAELTFGDDPDFQNIRNVYEGKMKEVKRSKRSTNLGLLGSGGFLIVIILILAIMGAIEGGKEDKLEAKLNDTVAEIQECIAEGDYDTALLKANTLRFDEDLDKKKAKKWDEQREDLIELINDQKEGK